MNPHRTTIQVASILLFSAGVAVAQAPGTTAPPPADQPAATEPTVPTSAPPTTERRQTVTEELVVTGSRIRRKDLTTPAPVTVVTREQFESSGRMTIGDYLQTMPEQGNAPNFQLNTGGINYGADGTTRINLRSLGIQRTLVLINGRRVVPGGLGASAAVDLNTIPTEAIERVEVLKDGASAVYGSDAIAGVVNVITRRSFNGTDLGAQYGLSGKGDAQTFDAHVTTGTQGDTAGAIFSARYFNQRDSWLRDRNWSQQALDYDYTGGGVTPSGSSRVPQGALRIPEDPNNPGTPLCNGNPFCTALTNTLGWSVTQRYIRNSTSSAGSTPVVCTTVLGEPECFRKFNTAAPDNNGTGNDFYNFAAQNYLTIPSTTIQGFSSGEAKFPVARGYYELSYTQRNSTQNAAPTAPEVNHLSPLTPGSRARRGRACPARTARYASRRPAKSARRSPAAPRSISSADRGASRARSRTIWVSRALPALTISSSPRVPTSPATCSRSPRTAPCRSRSVTSSVTSSARRSPIPSPPRVTRPTSTSSRRAAGSIPTKRSLSCRCQSSPTCPVSKRSRQAWRVGM